jgi:hypothetical protein
MLLGIRVFLILDIKYSLVEVPFVRVLLNVQELDILLEIVPVTHVPSTVTRKFRYLLYLANGLHIGGIRGHSL